MKTNFSKSLLLALSVCGAGLANAQVTLTAMTTFGGGDGWLAPAEYSSFGTDTTRGMAYNAATGNVMVVSRVGGTFLRVLNGTTGAEIGSLNLATAGVSGGTFAGSTVSISDDGQIFVANLTTGSATSSYKIYRWGSEADVLSAVAATNVYSGSPTGVAAGVRFGDSLDARGSGSSVQLVAGAGAQAGGNGYALFNQSGASSFTGNFLSVAGAANGDFRLGLTFGSGDQVLGSQGVGTFSGASRVRVTTFTGGSATLDGNATMFTGSERLFDHMELGGNKYFATVDNSAVAGGGNLVRVWDMNNPLTPNLLFINGALSNITTTTGTPVSNVNGVGNVRWGKFQGVASGGYEGTLYVMNTNNGIQAFRVNVVPEPATMTALGLGVAAMIRRRKQSRK